MKKILFVMFAVIVSSLCFVTDALAQHGGAVNPDSPTIQIAGPCSKFPKMNDCNSPQFDRLVQQAINNHADAVLRCCTKDDGGDKGTDAGKGPKLSCDKAPAGTPVCGVFSSANQKCCVPDKGEKGSKPNKGHKPGHKTAVKTAPTKTVER